MELKDGIQEMVKELRKLEQEKLFNIRISRYNEALYSKKELSSFLNVSVKTIDRLVSRGQIRTFKIGKCIRFNPREVLEDLEKLAY